MLTFYMVSWLVATTVISIVSIALHIGIYFDMRSIKKDVRNVNADLDDVYQEVFPVK